MQVKWYSPILLLVGAILSFADPITDILTLVEFYRSDHKTWFGVGLAFVILPCLVFPILYFSAKKDYGLRHYSCKRQCSQTILCGFHPFSAAFARLQGFVFCLKKLCCFGGIDSADNEIQAEALQHHIALAVLFESVLESAPQFIIQLYAVTVQDEPVEFIQIISLPVSFLSLAWAFSTADELVMRGELKIQHKLALFTVHLFLLSSRLFAVCYFTISHKWWVVCVLSCHSFVILSVDNCWQCLNDKCSSYFAAVSFFVFCVHCLRDDVSVQQLMEYDLGGRKLKTAPKRMLLLSNVLFVVENFAMILLFYFSEYSNTWYSLPVTVCVCLFSVLGSVMRVKIYKCIFNCRIVPYA